MKTVYMYAAVVAPTAVLVVGIVLWSQTPSTASVEKTAQYQRRCRILLLITAIIIG
jgi:hypothetical protein